LKLKAKYSIDVLGGGNLTPSHLHNENVLSSIPDREDIVFIQCDNDQIDDNNVVGYLRRNGVYIRYTHPYHSNMNYFIERSV
jgi:hypothetical protein